MRLIVLMILLGIAAPCAAQRPDSVRALVLGGGGARGIAHAGVVEGLEAVGWHPDIVVGTSMGAIVGALHAAGLPADSIVALMQGQAWAEIFAPSAEWVGPGRELRRPVLRAALEVGDGRFKQGFIPEWRINRLLTRLLFDAGARARGDFDGLARRYRAVAADLATGEAVVLGEGDLARAARASMAVPGVFSPVLWDDVVLVDGGVADYLPVAPARRLGAEAIVAVDVIRPPAELEPLGPVGVAERSLRFLLLNALPRGSAPSLLLVPEIPAGYSSASFPRDASDLIGAGRDALDGLVPSELPAGPGGSASASLPPPPTVLTGLIVDAPRRLVPLVRHAFQDIAAGPYDAEAILGAVDRLYATGLFTGVWPSVDERERLIVRAEAIPLASVQGAVGWDNDVGGRGWGELHRRTGLFGAPAELEAGASVTARDAYGWGVVRRLVASVPELSWSVGGYARDTDARVIHDGRLIAEAEVGRDGGWLALEHRGLTPAIAAVVQGVYERVRAPLAGEGSSWGGYLRVGAVPAHAAVVGVPARLEGEVRGGDVAYWRLGVQAGADAQAGPLLVAAFAAAERVDDEAPVDVRPTLGDPVGIPGLRQGELRGRQRWLAGADAAWATPVVEGYLRLRVAVGDSEAGTILDTRHDGPVAGIGLAGLWNTPWGPLELGGSVSTLERWRLDVSVGPRF